MWFESLHKFYSLFLPKVIVWKTPSRASRSPRCTMSPGPMSRQQKEHRRWKEDKELIPLIHIPIKCLHKNHRPNNRWLVLQTWNFDVMTTHRLERKQCNWVGLNVIHVNLQKCRIYWRSPTWPMAIIWFGDFLEHANERMWLSADNFTKVWPIIRGSKFSSSSKSCLCLLNSVTSPELFATTNSSLLSRTRLVSSVEEICIFCMWIN